VKRLERDLQCGQHRSLSSFGGSGGRSGGRGDRSPVRIRNSRDKGQRKSGARIEVSKLTKFEIDKTESEGFAIRRDLDMDDCEVS
jgi:hypothetical protein